MLDLWRRANLGILCLQQDQPASFRIRPRAFYLKDVSSAMPPEEASINEYCGSFYRGFRYVEQQILDQPRNRKIVVLVDLTEKP